MIGLIPTPAEHEAAMLEDLREWRRRQDDRNLEAHGAKLEREELDLLLAIADERDDLRGECEEDAEPPYPPLSAKVTQPMPFVDVRAYPEEAEINHPDCIPSHERTMLSIQKREAEWRELHDALRARDTEEHGARYSIAPPVENRKWLPDLHWIPVDERDKPCKHESGTVDGGGIVCASCGLLLAWIRFDFRPSE
jgi:hypothetical protein